MTAERNEWDDKFFRHLYVMTKLTMICGGRTPTIEELHQLGYDYPMNEHARAMCWVGHTFWEPINDDVLINDEHLLVYSNINVDSRADNS